MDEDDNIGDGARANLTAEEWDKVCKVRKIHELHPRRFPGREAAILLEHKGWDLTATLAFILEADPSKLRDVIDKKLSASLQKHKLRKKQQGNGGTGPPDMPNMPNESGKETRQFACPKEKNVWWKSVPKQNPFSTCLKCGQDYKPIPKEEEWGIGQFACDNCGHEFKAFAMMERRLLKMDRYFGGSESLCHGCWIHLCLPERILPPLRIEGLQGSRKSSHNCTGPNCYHRRSPASLEEPVVSICVHPTSLGTNFHGDGSKPYTHC